MRWDQAQAVVAQKGRIIFPTETVYGIGVGIDEEAVKELYRIKKRSFTKPLSLHIASLQQAQKYIGALPSVFHQLVEVFWPGPLTLIVPRSKISLPCFSEHTVALRMPSHPQALELLEQVGPLLATSANISEAIPTYRVEDIPEELKQEPCFILDAGRCSDLDASTLVSLVGSVRVIRQGPITVEQLAPFLHDMS